MHYLGFSRRHTFWSDRIILWTWHKKCLKLLFLFSNQTFDQCCGFVTFWYGSGSAPLTYGSGSCFFVSGWQDPNKKISFFKVFFLNIFEGTLKSFFKVKKKFQNSGNQGFSTFFGLLVEGSGSKEDQNIRILRIQIQIHNTAFNLGKDSVYTVYPINTATVWVSPARFTWTLSMLGNAASAARTNLSTYREPEFLHRGHCRIESKK